ncbi:hypothetical protein Taro_044022 [Colocasia esculenta]|uniref:Uncharacterized protein n=1 Tax=Colocasia esculenta TaxID=4460 RepID=A0A843WSW4_COLES|nr:hypothetical protein [Colocasia esculenta]
MSFTTCWGRVEELLVAGEQEIKHTKLIFFPCSSASTIAHCLLGVDQRRPDAFNALTGQPAPGSARRLGVSAASGFPNMIKA